VPSWSDQHPSPFPASHGRAGRPHLCGRAGRGGLEALAAARLSMGSDRAGAEVFCCLESFCVRSSQQSARSQQQHGYRGAAARARRAGLEHVSTRRQRNASSSSSSMVDETPWMTSESPARVLKLPQWLGGCSD